MDSVYQEIPNLHDLPQDCLREITTYLYDKDITAFLSVHREISAINTEKLSLGSGSRILEAGQAFHPKYKISVPKEGSS